MAMHQNLRVKTGAKNNQAAPLRAYEADSTTFVNTALFALNEKTDFSLDYQASLTDNYDEIDTGLFYLDSTSPSMCPKLLRLLTSLFSYQ